MATEINHRINAEFLELMVSSTFEIKRRISNNIRYMDITDNVIDFVKHNKDSIDLNEFGIFLKHYATYYQLLYCVNVFEFSTIQLENLNGKKDTLTKQFKARQVEYEKSKKRKVQPKGALFKDLSIEELIEAYAKSDTKDYTKYKDELEKREQNATTFGEKKRVKQTQQIIDAITKCYNKKQEINIEFIKEQYFGKKVENAVFEKKEKYSLEQKQKFTTDVLSTYVYNLVLLPKKQAKTMMKYIIEQCFDNFEQIDVKLVSDFVLQVGDGLWDNYNFCKKFSGYLTPDILRDQQNYIVEDFEDLNEKKTFYKNFASIKGVNVVEFERKFLGCGEHQPIDIINFAKDVKDVDFSLLDKFINIQVFFAVGEDDFNKTMAWEQSYSELQKVIEARNGTKRKIEIEDAKALDSYKESLQVSSTSFPSSPINR